MLANASRLSGRSLKAKSSQDLYRTSLQLTSESRCFTSSEYHQQHRRNYNKSGGPSQVASSSKYADDLPPISSEATNAQSNDSWSLRRRLRKLALNISPSAEPGEASPHNVKASSGHPSRPSAHKDKYKQGFNKQRANVKADSAGQNAMSGKGGVHKQQNERRAQAIAQKKEAQGKLQKAENASWDGIFSSVGASKGGKGDPSTGEAEPLFPDARTATKKHSGHASRWGDEFAEKFFSSPASKREASKFEEEADPSNDNTDQNKDYSDRDAPPHLSIAHEEEPEPQYRQSRSANEPRTELIRGASLAYHRRVEAARTLKDVQCTTNSNYLPVEQVPTHSEERRGWWDEEGKWSWTVGGTLSAVEVPVENVDSLREMKVPQLAHGLDRVLFNPGVHWLRDVRSGIYNYEPRIRNLQDVDLFDYSALPPYQTSSKDAELAELVRRLSKRYSGSTSSMTALLSHIYFLISAWKQPDLTGFTSGFNSLPKTYSFGARLPASIVLRRFEEQVGDEMKVRYAIDADKVSEGAGNNNYILMNLGKSVEKLLTSSPEEYSKYHRLNSHTLTQEEKTRKEAYHYAATDKILMRSQLDCFDERLPRKTFDLKTRAVIAIRQDRANWAESSGYMIRSQTGTSESFEREMWDMTRAALLKYYFQARIGNMDGIMVAYHSTATVFGFQYLPCEDMAMKLFSSIEMGEQAFRLSVGFLERLLDTITDIKPDHSLKITLDTEQRENPKMFAFVEAIEEGAAEKVAVEETAIESGHVGASTLMPEDEVAIKEGQEEESSEEEDSSDRQFRTLQLDVQVDRYLGEELVKGPVDFTIPTGYRINDTMEDEISRRKRASLPPLIWSVEYSITPRSDLPQKKVKENLHKIMSRKENLAPLILPNLEALNERERLREEELSKDEAVLQKFYEDRKSGLAMGMPVAPGQIQAEELMVSVGASDGDAVAASADAKEAKERPQQWKKRTSAIERLRELARLGKEDKDKEALTDTLEMYERRGD